jgi:pyruvate,water dikinase
MPAWHGGREIIVVAHESASPQGFQICPGTFAGREYKVRFILFPEDIDPSSTVGGKARALASMTEAELPIPPWFVVLPSAFTASVSSETADSVLQCRDDTQEIVSRTRLNAEVLEELDHALCKLAGDGGPFAVRSSALEEDSARFSFAGQLESFLFVSRDEVPAKVVSVWGSGFGERLMRYRQESGFDSQAAIPAVIVQLMIDGQISGVAFSADPVSGRRAIAVVGAVPGLGSGLVSGEAAADTWRIDRNGAIIERAIANKTVMHRRDMARPEGVSAVVLAETLATKPALDEDQVRRIALLARRAETHFGCPQDIEWTVDSDRLYLLQSRAITTLADRTDPDGRLMLWDNSNIIESYSGVTTPLTFSFARNAYEHVYREFCRLMRVPLSVIEANGEMFYCMLGLIRGRVYYNLFNWYRLVSLLPGYRFNRRFLEQMLGVSESLAEELPARQRHDSMAHRWLDGARFIVSLIFIALNLMTLSRRIARFYQRLRETLGESRPDLSGMSATEMVEYYRGLERRLLNHWDAPVVNDFGAMIFHGLLRHFVAAWIGSSEGTLQNDLLCAERGMISEEPAQRVRAMAQLAALDPELVSALVEGRLSVMRAAINQSPDLQSALDDYLDKFGDRCMGELKLESPTLRDDPTPLLRAVGQYARALALLASRGDGAAELGVREQAEARVRAALARHPWRRFIFNCVLKGARARVLARENLRFERTRVFGRVRHIFIELGKRLAAIDCLEGPRDIFYLEIDEVLGFVEGRATTTNLKGLVCLRKAEFDGWRQMAPPDDRFKTRGVIYRGNSFTADQPPAAPAGESLLGIGCCPGLVRGPVRLVRDPRDAAVKVGEIVVADRTDPGWVMIFPVISGLLVERGSLLSHSAIVARELGLPTIVGLTGVTAWLKDGDWVEMNGGTGVVARVQSPARERREGSTAGGPASSAGGR